jgi:hypothetical protein
MEYLRKLQTDWQAKGRFRGLHARMALEKDGVVLGAGTVLAGRDTDGALALDGEDARILTLLSVARGAPVAAGVIDVFRRASHHAAVGDEAMASMHVALAEFPPLSDPEDSARRLFIADGLLVAGVEPRDIWRALEFDPSEFNALEKFDPNQPRNPAGDGRASGEWTRDADVAAEDLLEAGVEGTRAAAVTAGVRIAVSLGGLAGLFLLASTTHAGATPEDGPVLGRPDLRYRWNADEGVLLLYRGSDPNPLWEAHLAQDGTFRVAPQRVIGRFEQGKILLYPFTLPPLPGAQAKDDDDRKRLCPKEQPDRPGRSAGRGGEKDKDYEDQMKALVNPPGDRTPRNFGYAFPNPENGHFIIFDDCQHKTGFLFDAKGDYDWFLKNQNLTKKLGDGFLKQADNQIAASGGREIFWCFAQLNAAQSVRQLFDNNEDVNVRRIHIFYMPRRQGSWTEISSRS